MIRVCKEESFHQRQGYELLTTMMSGTDAQRDGPGLRRPLVVAGVDDVRPTRCGFAEHRTVDGLGHQEAYQRRVEAALRRHVRSAGGGARGDLPDPELRWNEERGAYDFGTPDWDEFMDVVRGHGPCNDERIAIRKRAHDSGAWVREAAMAYAAKAHPTEGQL